MAFTLYTQSFGPTYANGSVLINEAVSGLPATILATAIGGVVNTNGQATLDLSGNLSVYIDTAKTYIIKPFDGSILVSTPTLSLSDTDVVQTRILVSRDGFLLKPPQNVAALAGNTIASVYFETNLNATSYLAVASTGETAIGTTSPITLTLSNGVARTITVQAVNGPTYSIASARSNSVTPSAAASTAMGATLATGLEFWIEPRKVASPPSNGANVTQILDLSGNGYHFALDGNLFTPATWVSSWSSGKPALAFDGTGSSGYTTKASGLAANTYGPLATFCAVFDLTGQPNLTGVYEQRILSCEGQGGGKYLVANNRAGWALAITPTANSGANNCMSVHSQSGATLNGRGAGLSVQSAQLTSIGQKLMVIALAPGVMHVSQNGGGTWTQVAGINKPGSDGLGNFTGADSSNFCWTLGSMLNGSFAANFRGRLSLLTKHNRVFTAADVTAMKTYMTGLI